MGNELSVGQGPYRAKVVQMLPGRAMVDMQVGRKVAKEGNVNVLGTLQFKDSVEVESVAVNHDQWLVENDDDDDSESVITASLEDLDSFDFDDEEEEEEEG